MKGDYKTHMAAAGDPEHTACGLAVTQQHAGNPGAYTTMGRSPWTGTLPLATRPDKITCANCLEKLYSGVRR